MKLRYSEIKPFRDQLLVKQQGCCALCGEIVAGDEVLDHDHKTGKIRQVLHRGCNSLLGKIENNLARNRVTAVRLRHFSANLIKYIEQEYEDIVHPTYLTKEERKMKGYKKKKGGGKRKGY